ncbi:hypothetical protein PybrP1_004595 [[Pythium] brassicae (nom. inval.)]|nr:hypothetical protein PybrP1_004595 [[Pythium] brassicae (nom. inval.)]
MPTPAASPRELVLRHVLLFHRHGDRAPVLPEVGTKWRMTPDELAFWRTRVATDEQLAQLAGVGRLVGAHPALPPPPPSSRPYSHPLGELTQLGVEHMRGKGRSLRAKYGHLLAAAADPSEHVYVLSSSVPRTVQSVQCLLHGMFHEDDGDDDAAPSAPDGAPAPAAPPVATPMFDIRTYERNVLAPYHSLRVFMEIEAIVRADVEKRAPHEQAQTAALAAHLRGALGIAPDVPLPWTAIRDGLTCRAAHGLALPEGITADMAHAISTYDAWLWYRLYEQKEFCFQSFQHGVREVYDHLKRVVAPAAADSASQAPPPPPPKLAFFSAHDNSIVALVSALQLQVGLELPEYGTIVAFEVYEDVAASQHYLKVLFEDRAVPFAGHEHDALCPFAHFEALATEFLALGGGEQLAK